LTARGFSTQADFVSDRERIRVWRKTAPQGPTPLTLAIGRARQGRTLHALALHLDMPLGTLRQWLLYPPRRTTRRVRLVTERLIALGFIS
jgi:hypothetical protein